MRKFFQIWVVYTSDFTGYIQQKSFFSYDQAIYFMRRQNA